MYNVLNKQENAHQDGIWCCSWSKIQDTGDVVLATGSLDRSVKIWHWDDVDLKEHVSLEPQQLGVISLSFNADGSKMISSSLECCVKIYQTSDFSKIGEINAAPVDSWTACMSPDGSRIASGAQNGKINVFLTETGAKEATLKAGEKFIMNVAYSPDGKHLAGASMEGMIYIFDIETMTQLHSVEAHALPIRRIKFSSDGKLLFSAADDKYAKVHNITSSTSLVGTFPGHSSVVTSLDVSADDRRLATCSTDRTVRLWDLAERETLHKFDGHTDHVWDVAFSPNGSRLASVSEDKSLILWSTPL